MSTDPQFRPLANEEIGFLVRMFRESLQWSQETLAESCNVTVRTIQRVEKGEPSSFDTRRAIARAFEFEDIDYFNKLHTVPTEEELKSAQEELQKNRLILDVTVAASARDLASDFATSTGDVSGDPQGRQRVDAPLEFCKDFNLLDLRKFACAIAIVAQVIGQHCKLSSCGFI